MNVLVTGGAHFIGSHLVQRLVAVGMPSGPYFIPIRLQPYYRERYGLNLGDFLVTERILETTITIPFLSDMSLDQVESVCKQNKTGVTR